MNGLGWLTEYSEPALRSALRVAGGGLDQLPIELTGTNDLGRPTWASGSAKIDGRFLAKPGIDLLTSTVDHYAALTGRRLSLERIIALHIRTALGDALWRSEAGRRCCSRVPAAVPPTTTSTN